VWLRASVPALACRRMRQPHECGCGPPWPSTWLRPPWACRAGARRGMPPDAAATLRGS